MSEINIIWFFNMSCANHDATMNVTLRREKIVVVLGVSE